jgi:protein involved in polysaccharide export with SLBB domain
MKYPKKLKMCGHQNVLSLFIAGGSNTERAQKSHRQTTRQRNGPRGTSNVHTDVLQEDHEGHEELHLKYQVSIKTYPYGTDTQMYRSAPAIVR